MKKQWQTPELKVLDVSMTMASTRNPGTLDLSYPAGTRNGKIWS